MKKIAKIIAKSFGFEIRRTSTPQGSGPYQVMRHLVRKPEPVIFDVGAYIGHAAAQFRDQFPKARIHCFEPFPPSFELLAAAFREDAHIACHRLALADRSSVSKFQVNQSAVTNSLLTSDGRGAHYWGSDLLEKKEELEVETDTIDRFCEQQGISHIDILKLDVQGAEYSVLEGARRMLQDEHIDLIYMEMIMAPTYVGQRKYHEYLALFDALGYELFDIYNPCRKDGRLIQSDQIIVRSGFLTQYEGFEKTNAG